MCGLFSTSLYCCTTLSVLCTVVVSHHAVLVKPGLNCPFVAAIGKCVCHGSSPLRTAESGSKRIDNCACKPDVQINKLHKMAKADSSCLGCFATGIRQFCKRQFLICSRQITHKSVLRHACMCRNIAVAVELCLPSCAFVLALCTSITPRKK